MFSKKKYGRFDIPIKDISEELAALADNVSKGLITQAESDKEEKALKANALMAIAVTNASSGNRINFLRHGSKQRRIKEQLKKSAVK